MTTTTAALTALAQRLAETGLARYSPTGAYSKTGLPAVFFGGLQNNPASAVAVAAYNDDRDRQDAGAQDLYVQLRWRAGTRDPRDTDNLADAAFTVLGDAVRQTWPGGLWVLACRRTIRGPTEPDDQDRWTRPDSYRITLTPGDTP